MPIYAYRCASCGHAKDVLQKIADPLLTICPSCGESTFQKQVTAAGFQLKGSGWYATDFKGGSSTGAATQASSPATGSTSTDAAPSSGSTSDASSSNSAAHSCAPGCTSH
jgi:putative FmdB family regulatory protein